MMRDCEWIVFDCIKGINYGLPELLFLFLRGFDLTGFAFGITEGLSAYGNLV